jgi:hypothetical protein
MTTLYDITFPPLINALKSAQNLVAQAETYSAEKGTPLKDLFEARLAPDMWPLSQQIVITALHSAMTVAKLTGATPNKIDFGPASVEDSKRYLAETLETLKAVKPEDVNGKESTIVGAMMGPGAEANMTAFNYVQGYLLPNVYFHLTTLYDILRSKGVPLGKKEYLGSFVTLA